VLERKRVEKVCAREEEGGEGVCYRGTGWRRCVLSFSQVMFSTVDSYISIGKTEGGGGGVG
jgi:hypothetical protein